jgi:hypothetical protein
LAVDHHTSSSLSMRPLLFPSLLSLSLLLLCSSPSPILCQHHSWNHNPSPSSSSFPHTRTPAPAPQAVHHGGGEHMDCTKAQHECLKTPAVVACVKQHGCSASSAHPNSGLHHLQNPYDPCNVAYTACSSHIDECLLTLGPDGCTAASLLSGLDTDLESNNTNTSKPRPPFYPDSPTPTPQPSEDIECAEAITFCKNSKSFVTCREQAGCDDATAHTDACDYAASVCHDVIVDCLLFFGPKDCTL